MNPAYGLMFGAIVGVVGGTVTVFLLGLWALPLTIIFVLAGIWIGERL